MHRRAGTGGYRVPCTASLGRSAGRCRFHRCGPGRRAASHGTVPRCSTPHEGDVLAIYRHPDSEYPGQQNLHRIAAPALGDAADVLRQASQLPTSTRKDLIPTETDWQAGERTSITLLAANNSFELLDRGYFDPEQAETTVVAGQPE